MQNTNTKNTNKVTKVINTKKAILTVKDDGKIEIKKPLIQWKLETRDILTAKIDKTTFDYVKLANVTDYIEDKSPSKIYKVVIESVFCKDILGQSKIPTFAEFLTKLPTKQYFSRFDGYKTLAKFNVANELGKKVAKQNKKIAAK